MTARIPLNPSPARHSERKRPAMQPNRSGRRFEATIPRGNYPSSPVPRALSSQIIGLELALFVGAALLPFALAWIAGKAAHDAFVSARLALYRRQAQVERQFAKRCAARLRDLRGASGAVYRRALRELVAERRRLEDEREVQSLNEQPGALARRAAGRARRDKAWARWFRALDRSAGRVAPPPPGRRGAPIRRLCERSVAAPPSARALREQWEKARGRGPLAEKLRLGSMLLDAEATVDSSLIRDLNGEIVGRRGGLRAWLDETCPALSRHYAALMGYRRLAAEFRAEQGLADPAPAALLLAEDPATETKLPPGTRAALPGLRKAALRVLAEAGVSNAKALRARLLAARDARAAALGRRRLA